MGPTAESSEVPNTWPVTMPQNTPCLGAGNKQSPRKVYLAVRLSTAMSIPRHSHLSGFAWELS
jgi:hypothetical protein